MGVFVTTSLYGQWVAGTGQMSTGNYVAIGNSTSPHVDTALRLSAPVGRLPDRPCTTSQPVISDCLQLGFGTPAAMWWGFKLDANNDLHLIRQNGTWKDGMTFTREGKVAISGGSIPLRIDAANAGGFGVEFLDLTAFSYPNSMAIDMGGPNSHIRVANLQLSNLGVPVVRSTTDTSPLYLNLWTHSDVVIGSADTSYANMGLRVEGQGKSTFRGAVGIGTTAPNPLYKLHVVGNANFDGTVTGTNIKAHYQDVAEWVPAAAPLAPATVVVLDPARPNHVSASSRSYDTSVAGVVSAQPGIVLGDEGPSKALIATTGRVLVRVDASRQSIAIGDLLVTSDKPGVAMKSIPIDLQGITLHRPGTVVGKALEPLADGEGEILVLLSLQ
ncbi:MAG: hypothetical protein ACJ74H_03270 [Thermoanaerobaculia bacterium]